MGTKNNPGAFDCYANATPDEPMFVLLGRDRHAPVLVRLWALLRHKEGEDAAKVAEDAAKVAEALACADAMDKHFMGLGKQVDWGLGRDLLQNLTEGMDEHPDGFNEPCDCNRCRSYD